MAVIPVPPAPLLFRLENVGFQYGSGKDVLQEINLALPAGGVIALVGSNGAGKSTLLSLLSLLWENGPTRGRITYRPGQPDEVRFDSAIPGGAAAFRQRTFGFIPQSAELLPYLTVGENMSLPLRILGHDSASCQARVRAWWEEFYPPEHLEVLGRYQGSGGEKRLAMAFRGLAHDPQVIFCDEPFNDLDLTRRARLLQRFRDWVGPAHLPRRRTLFLVWHELDPLFNTRFAPSEGQGPSVPLVDYFVPLCEGKLIRNSATPLAPFTYDQVREGGGVELLHKWVPR